MRTSDLRRLVLLDVAVVSRTQSKELARHIRVDQRMGPLAALCEQPASFHDVSTTNLIWIVNNAISLPIDPDLEHN